MRKPKKSREPARKKAVLRALTQRLRRCVEESGLVETGERLGVAVSGGADSVALLLLLVELKSKVGIALHVLHYNHQLRGRAADADEKFVAALAARYKLPLFRGTADVRAIAKRDRCNVEDAARKCRYAFFSEMVEAQRLEKIAVAHTADDQAETVLAHLLRGSGITGLAGIHPKAGKIVRPLLSVRRDELRAYLKLRKQAWREDATNRDATKTRARIRKKLIPLLEKEFQPRVVEHLAALARHARHDDALLDQLAAEKLDGKVEMIPGGVQIRVADLLGNDTEDVSAGLSSRGVRFVVNKVKGTQKNSRAGELSSLHVAQILRLAREGKTGASLPLPGGIQVRRHRDVLTFCSEEKRRIGAGEYQYKIDSVGPEKRIAVPELGCAFRFTVIDWVAQRGETSISGEVLDEKRLKFPLTLRNWRYGDRFRAKGHTRPQKLKRLFNERRIDRWRREGWPVIAGDDGLVWSRGFGAAADFLAGEATKTGILIAEEQLP